MARVKATSKVTLSLPNALLEVSDFLAEGLGLDRYDVLKMALAQGLVVMEVQRQALGGQFAAEGQAAADMMSDPATFADRVVANTKQEATRRRAAKRKVEPESMPEATPEPMGFQRPRSEGDELAIIGAPLVAPDAPMWTGYMANL